MELYDVVLSKKAQKALKKIPAYISVKLTAWIDDVGHRGLREVRKVKGYHDEPLAGSRKGQRSIRLSKGYRAIYRINAAGEIEFVEILEVNKHGY